MKYSTLIAGLVVTLLFASGTSIFSADTNSSRKRFDLTKLRKFSDDKNMDDNVKMQEMLTYLKEEVTHPSWPGRGFGGGPIDTVYVQRVIIGVMGQTVSRETLLEALNKETDAKIRDRLKIALVSAGDKTFLYDIQSFLQNTGDNLLRLASAWALRGIADKDLGDLEPLLISLHNDTYSRVVFRDVGNDAGSYKVYPIRQAAYEALTRLGARPKGWILEVKLKVDTQIEAIRSILDDENPQQCVTILRMLRDYPGP